MRQTICDKCKGVIIDADRPHGKASELFLSAGRSVVIRVAVEPVGPGADEVDVCKDCVFQKLHDWACKETTIDVAAPS